MAPRTARITQAGKCHKNFGFIAPKRYTAKTRGEESDWLPVDELDRRYLR